MSTAKPSARFLPTLTEVVQMVPAEVALQKTAAGHEEQLIQRAMELLEVRMREQMNALAQSQAQNVLNAMRDEMKRAVTDAVKQALREAQ